MIEFQNVAKLYGKRPVLTDVNFRIEPGEFVCLTGPSGAGKSTLVHLFIRAEIPTKGSVLVDGKDLMRIPAPMLQLYRRRTGVVFQDYKLLGDRTVQENIAFPMEVCGGADAAIRKRVGELLDRVGLAARAGAFPHELSGGEKARVGIARALAHAPMIVIADEPTGNVDPEQSLDILRILKEVNDDGVTVILATHDMEIIRAAHARLLHLVNGTITRDGSSSHTSGDKHHLFDRDSASPKKKDNGRTGKVRPIGVE